MLKIKNINTSVTSHIVLEKDEVALDIDTGRIKIGDGVTPWINLPYVDKTYIDNYNSTKLVSISDLEFIKETASKLCGIADNLANMFGEDDEIPNEIDKIEYTIINKITSILM